MSLVLDTGTMKYRENPNQPWRPLVIKAGMNWESMADTYDPDNGTYEVGQYVLEEGMMYRCISEITTPEVWTPAHWTSVNVGDELSSFIIISDDQPTDETNKIWIAETTAPFGVQVPTMDDHNALGNTLNQLDQNMAYVESGNTASRPYSGGEFISWKGTLYTASGSISLGQSFSTGTGGNLADVVDGNGDPCGGLNDLRGQVKKWEYLGTNYGSAATTISQYDPTKYSEILLCLVLNASPGYVQASTVDIADSSSSPTRANYRTDDSSLRYCEFTKSTKVLAGNNAGYNGILYAR